MFVLIVTNYLKSSEAESSPSFPTRYVCHAVEPSKGEILLHVNGGPFQYLLFFLRLSMNLQPWELYPLTSSLVFS